MTKETFLERLKRLEAEATPGPWHAEHYTPNHPVNDSSNSWATRLWVGRQEIIGFDHRWNRRSDDPGESPNAEIIVVLRNAAPKLIRLLEAFKVRYGRGACNCDVCTALRDLDQE